VSYRQTGEIGAICRSESSAEGALPRQIRQFALAEADKILAKSARIGPGAISLLIPRSRPLIHARCGGNSAMLPNL